MLWNRSWVWLPVKLNLRCQLHVAVLPLLRLAGCKEWQAGCWLFQCKNTKQPHTAERYTLCSLFDFCRTGAGLCQCNYVVLTHSDNNPTITMTVTRSFVPSSRMLSGDEREAPPFFSPAWTCLYRNADRAANHFRGGADASNSACRRPVFQFWVELSYIYIHTHTHDISHTCELRCYHMVGVCL